MLRYALIVLSVLIGFNATAQNIDLRIVKSLNQTDHPGWDKTMKFTSDAVVPFMGLSTAGILIVGYAKKDQALIRDGWKSGIAIGATFLISQGLKAAIKRQRPYQAYPDEIVCRQKASGFSFPSGHTSSAFATATCLTLTTKKWYVGVPAYAYASLVAYSRMRLGDHYPSDVLAGIIVGIGTSLLTWQVDKWIHVKN